MDAERLTICGRECFVCGSPAPEYILIQPTGRHELGTLGSELAAIRSLTDKPFAFAAFMAEDWNAELSPWEAPPVFGSEPFGGGAADTLGYVERRLIPRLGELFPAGGEIPLILGGYSLAGLFSLWSAYSSESFAAAACVSPSVWFTGWLGFAEERRPSVGSVYLSIGRKEEKTRNKAMSAVGDNIRRQHELLEAAGICTVLEWNEGNHFTDPEFRTAKGFAWCIENT